MVVLLKTYDTELFLMIILRKTTMIYVRVLCVLWLENHRNSTNVVGYLLLQKLCKSTLPANEHLSSQHRKQVKQKCKASQGQTQNLNEIEVPTLF